MLKSFFNAQKNILFSVFNYVFNPGYKSDLIINSAPVYTGTH